MSVYEKLMKIQGSLKAPKGQYNRFGNFNYRSCEDILEALKPLLVKYKALVTINDRLVQIGERYYVEACATLIDVEDGANVSVMAYAREAESKKGMDESQVTGATSSYARKYALNGLFAIDDNKDMDRLNNEEAEWNKEQKRQSNPKQEEIVKAKNREKFEGQEQELIHMFDIAKSAAISKSDLRKEMKERFGKINSSDLTKEEINEFINWMSQKAFA